MVAKCSVVKSGRGRAQKRAQPWHGDGPKGTGEPSRAGSGGGRSKQEGSQVEALPAGSSQTLFRSFKEGFIQSDEKSNVDV